MAGQELTVIVGAYGPTSTTRKAVARARSLVGGRGRVVVFAGNRGGVRAAEQSRAGGVTVVDGHGRAGLHAALALAGNTPVLFVHDDVLVTPAACRALATAHGAVGGLIVPASNDAATDHFVGPLPPVARASGALTQLRAPASGRRTIHAVRPSCVYGLAFDLERLVRHHLTAPGTIMNSPERLFTLAPDAVVAHDSTCTVQLLPPVGPDGRPLLVAALIVRDEEAMLAECLASLAPLVDRIEVCDTGSTDRTVEIARAAGANVSAFAWCDDFSAARNAVLDRCRDAWYVLQIDADERVACADPVKVRRRLATAIDEHLAYKVELANLTVDGREQSRFEAVRLFAPQHYRNVNALHERIEPLDGTPALDASRLDELALVHLGYQATVVLGKSKSRRNAEIARREYEQKRSPETALNYARSLAYEHSVGADVEPREVKALFEEALARRETFNAGAVAHILAHLGAIALREGDAARAFAYAAEGVQLVPADDHCAEVYGRAALTLGLPDAVLEMAELRSRMPSAPPMHVGESHRAAARSQTVAALAQVGAVEEAFAGALEVLEANGGDFDAWGQLARGLWKAEGADAVERLAVLALRDTRGRIFHDVDTAMPADVVASLCALYLEAGGSSPEAVTLGLLGALVEGRDDLFARVSPYAPLLDPGTVEGIAERARLRGNEAFADELLAALFAPAGL